MTLMNEVNPADLEKHLGLVVHVAGLHRRYLGDSKLDFEDLIAWGVLGLHHALRLFDPKKGVKFSSYAGRCIHGYMLSGMRSLRREAWSMRRRGEEVSEICLDALSPENEILGDDHSPFEDEVIERLSNQQLLDQVWAHIPQRQREIVELVLYSGLDQSQIAKKIGCCSSLVSLMWCRTINTAKEIFGVEDMKEAA
jgi:RNA polymerase sigma factor (sigma-70 family)